MSHKKKVFIIFILAVVIMLVSLILALPEKVGLCSGHDVSCKHGYIDNYNNLVQIGFIFSIPLIIISILLLFLKDQIFVSWSRLAIFFLPIAIIIIAITPSTSGSISPIEKEPVTLLLAAFFLIVSIILITIKSLKLRSKEK
jgi:hypothetical protein